MQKLNSAVESDGGMGEASLAWGLVGEMDLPELNTEVYYFGCGPAGAAALLA